MNVLDIVGSGSKGLPGRKLSGKRETLRDCLVIFAVAATFYLAFRSSMYIGDGLRWLPTILDDSFPHEGGGTRHFYFPFYAWTVHRLATLLGFTPGDGPTQGDVIALMQASNALLAATTVTLVYAWLRTAVSRRAAFFGIAFTALSNAFTLHATDMTEPIVGTVPSMLGIFLLARRPEHRPTRIAAAMLIGVATAFYLLSCVAVLPGAWLVLRRGLGASAATKSKLRETILFLAVSGLTYLALIVAFELTHRADAGAAAAVKQGFFFHLHGMYGRFHPKYLLGSIIGFASALCLIPPHEGMSRLHHQPPATIAAVLAVTTLFLGFVAALSLEYRRSRSRLKESGLHIDLVAALLWILGIYALAVYFLSGYEKIWIFAMPALGMVAAIAAESVLTGEATSRRVRFASFAVPGIVLLAANVAFGVIPRRIANNQDLAAALDLSRRVGPNDLLVCAGWDPPSVHLLLTLKRPIRCFSLTRESIHADRQQAVVTGALAERVRRARALDAHVYFFGLLDIPRDRWALFFEKDLLLSYEALAPYRDKTRVAGDVLTTNGRIKLFELVE